MEFGILKVQYFLVILCYRISAIIFHVRGPLNQFNGDRRYDQQHSDGINDQLGVCA